LRGPTICSQADFSVGFPEPFGKKDRREKEKKLKTPSKFAKRRSKGEMKEKCLPFGGRRPLQRPSPKRKQREKGKLGGEKKRSGKQPRFTLGRNQSKPLPGEAQGGKKKIRE